MMSFPEPGGRRGSRSSGWRSSTSAAWKGTFRVNPKARVESVQVRVFETGSNQPRATQTVSL